MKTKQVVQLDPAGYFAGVTLADQSPLEPGVFLMPAGAIDAPVPKIPEGKRAKWSDGWVFEDITEPAPEPEVTEPEPDISALRRAAYQAEADPLFFKYQRGEATQEEWLAKLAEIKARYPEK